MNAAQFAREQARIERTRGRTARWRKRAMQHLMAEAGAVTIIIRGQAVGWMLQSGERVCVMRRYQDHRAANDDLASIWRLPGTHARPVRAFRCPHCHGFHLAQGIG